jgi:hypothetical protein
MYDGMEDEGEEVEREKESRMNNRGGFSPVT